MVSLPCFHTSHMKENPHEIAAEQMLLQPVLLEMNEEEEEAQRATASTSKAPAANLGGHPGMAAFPHGYPSPTFAVRGSSRRRCEEEVRLRCCSKSNRKEPSQPAWRDSA